MYTDLAIGLVITSMSTQAVVPRRRRLNIGLAAAGVFAGALAVGQAVGAL